VGDAGILKAERQGGFCPLPHRSIPPTVQCMGEPEERAGAGAHFPGYGLSPGIAMTIPRPGRGGGGGRRPGGVGDANVLKSETGGGFCPLPPWRYLPRSSVWENLKKGPAQGLVFLGTAIPRVSPRLPPPRAGGGEGLRMHGRGGGCRHIESRETGGLLPPPPQEYTSHGPVYGRT
jgi:hypothetical protein